MEGKKMMRLKEAAEALGMSESWLDKAIRARSIQVVWFGGIRMISEDEIERIKKEGVKIEKNI